MKFLRLMLVVVAIGFSSNSNADVAIKGSASCGEWIQYRSPTSGTEGGWRTLVSQSWLMGYLSGLAVGRNKNFMQNTDAQSIYLWMDNFCNSNPLDNLDTGGYVLADELQKRMKR